MADFREYIGMDSSEFLTHYGVAHDQGGHSGRYPWGSGDRPRQSEGPNKKQARKYQRQLNRLEKRRATARVYGDVVGEREQKSRIKKVIEEMESNGYSVGSKEYNRYVDKGEMLVGFLLAGPLGMAIASAAFRDAHSTTANKYKVKVGDQAEYNTKDALDAFSRLQRDKGAFDVKYDKRDGTILAVTDKRGKEYTPEEFAMAMKRRNG